METETKQKISETVMAILKEADMEEMTEYKIRQQASQALGMNLSEPESKRFVRQLVESYLLDLQSVVEAEPEPVPEPEPAAEAENADKEVIEEEDEEVEEEEREEASGRGKMLHAKEFDEGGDLIICKLSNKRKVTIQDFRGKTLVSIREYYSKDGKELPSSKGISLSADQWSTFSKNIPAVEKAIKKMEARLM